MIPRIPRGKSNNNIASIMLGIAYLRNIGRYSRVRVLIREKNILE